MSNSFLLFLLNSRSDTQARTLDTALARYEVASADESHEGAYLCRASNEAGQAEEMLQVGSGNCPCQKTRNKRLHSYFFGGGIDQVKWERKWKVI